MKKYVILYDERIGPIVVGMNCSHVFLKQEEPPSLEDMRAAVESARAGRGYVLPMSCIHVTGYVELRAGVPYHVPFARIWPFTSRWYDRTFAREDAEATRFPYQPELEPQEEEPPNKYEGLWMLLSFCSGMYVFGGIGVCVYTIAGGNWLLICLALLAYVLNLVLLSYANKQW